MIDHGKKNILGILVSAVDYDAAVEQIIAAAHAGRSLAVAALAVHGIMTGVRDKTHKYRLNNSDLIVPDGQPVRWALNWLYHTALPDRVYGPTLMLRVCERAACDHLSVYLYGSEPEVSARLAARLAHWFPGLVIAGAEPSRFRTVSPEEQQQIARQIRDSGARLVFVGLGCPRQEVWIYEYAALLPMPLIAVGAAFDFHAGTKRQAPVYLQDRGLEWVFRLAQEPRRLWRRYLLLNPLYLWLLFMQAARLRRFDPADAAPPDRELRYG